MAIIETTQELAALCRRAAAHPFVAVDTEFLRESTFWPKLCVVQLATPEEAWAVDALADGIDLAPLLELFADRNVTKTFHAARQDLEIFWKMSGELPRPLFDTQIAAMACGYGEQVSYAELAHTLDKATIDKSSRFTDWTKRPLSEAQIAYALADVTHLRVIYAKLRDRIAKSGRQAWLEDETAVLLNPATYEQKPEDAWRRFAGRARKPRDLAMLMELAGWREAEAQARDVPRSRVLKDDLLVEIALAAPKDAGALAALRAVPRGMERSRGGADVLDAIARGFARDPATLPALPARRNGAAAGATVELLKVLLRQVSEEAGVAAKIIATVEDLEAIAQSDDADTPALQGWRHDLFGARALRLKRGEIALTVERGKVVTLEWRENAEPA
ncbi:MAG: ribonuclease D [Hyphomicrobiales bacterium]|nr:ribonuclease D [Hyphomicrobiales bacterium]MDE2017461.1 ribonuclease D [Hyphomicrobiales bacterium]